MPDRRRSGLLVLVLVMASLIALYEVATVPRLSSDATGSPKTRETIRRFYAGLNQYMESGDASAVSLTLAPGALAFEPDLGVLGDDSELLTYLIALRSTLPDLRFVVDSIDVGDEIAIASVRRSGAADLSALGSTGETAQEFFRVRDGRIVQHWTTAPSSVLLHSLASSPSSIELTRSSHLAMAELELSPGRNGPQPIDGPALVLVERGRLTLRGNGSSQILDIAGGSVATPAPNEMAYAEPGQAISIPRQSGYVWNSDAATAFARVMAVVYEQPVIEATIPGARQPPPLALDDMSLMRAEGPTTYSSVTVRPLAFDDRPVPAGNWNLDFVWAVLGPGASLSPAEHGERVLVDVISGSAHLQTLGHYATGTQDERTNQEEKPIIALIIKLRPTP